MAVYFLPSGALIDTTVTAVHLLPVGGGLYLSGIAVAEDPDASAPPSGTGGGSFRELGSKIFGGNVIV